MAPASDTQPSAAREHGRGPGPGCFLAFGVLLAGIAVALFWKISVGFPLAALGAFVLSRIIRREAQLGRDQAARERARLQSIAPPRGDSWRPLLLAEGLGALVEKVEPMTRPAVRITTRRAEQQGVGQSRIGGMPDLPSSIAWPRRDGIPLAFLAQIDLADVAALLPDGPLPSSGHLWFFYDMKAWPGGDDPKDAGGAVVHYQPAGLALSRAVVPAELSEKWCFPSCAVALESYQDIPELGDIDGATELLKDDEEKRERYYAIQSYLRGGESMGEAHKLLGWANPIQGPMEIDCQLVTNGISKHTDPRANALVPSARDWRLLFQCESDGTAEMMWGDAGRLYFWIREQDLRAAVFERTWTILQCH
jgi:hypothetical protein